MRRQRSDKGGSHKKSSKNRALRSDAGKAHNSQRGTADGGTAKAKREKSLDGRAEKRAREAKEQAESAALMKKMLTQTPAERREERRAEVVEQVCRLSDVGVRTCAHERLKQWVYVGRLV